MRKLTFNLKGIRMAVWDVLTWSLTVLGVVLFMHFVLFVAAPDPGGRYSWQRFGVPWFTVYASRRSVV